MTNMKNKSIITILSLCLGLSIATTSCEDMLTSDSNRHSYEIAGDTLYSYWGILKSLQNLGERYVVLGECRGDLIDGGEFTTDSIKAILSFGLNGDEENIRDGANRYLKVSDYYHVINSCNAYIAMVDTAMNTSTGDRYMIREYAQVEAIRAWTYMQLVINYGEVPFYLDAKLSTGNINNFGDTLTNTKVDPNDPNTKPEEIEKYYKYRVNASNLWQKLEKKLIRAYQIEEQWGFPQYNDYGFKSAVCHSSKTMFPTSLVLADLYLMGNQYEKAAAYYYEFLDGQYGGTLPNNYYSMGYLRQGETTPNVSVTGYPWNETGATSKSQESITAIPSSTNSLWGTVQRGVNELYGFDASISQFTNSGDSTTSASVHLTRNWERQLGPSSGYDALRMSQNFEVYQVSSFSNIDDPTQTQLVVLDGVGDARGISSQYGSGYIARFNSGDYYVDETRTQRYIMKQNPSGSYSTVFPMVYRKSMVWLRFAEALNRAGYPSYAFAILKNGLTRNSSWLPANESDFEVEKYRAYYQYTKETTGPEDEITTEEVILPADWEDNDVCQITNPLYNYAQFQEDSTALVNYIKENYPGVLDEVEDPGQAFEYTAESYLNYIPEDNNIVCDYINRKEWQNAQGKEWMDFDKGQFNGAQALPVGYIEDFPMLQNTRYSYSSYSTGTSATKTITRGIHQKGCGLLKYNEKHSSYNYVDQINLKLGEKGIQLTKDEIYDGSHQKDVIEAIEELILDEEGLELAFEGSRFFDIMRVANRKSDPGAYMAKKIRSRGAGVDMDFDPEELRNVKNWYLPLPDLSYRDNQKPDDNNVGDNGTENE